ncbi:MAG TPA: SDR family NAD(P)-dependent oxidoreductase [Bryobacteraceae bacterium]|nr:SDR family NAD(P)-dependent oxidoreductase [Bryobacteraceae bacterium]
MARPVALITGASSGIGETFARKLAAQGFDLILIARREEKLHALAAQLPASARIIPADLTREEGLAAAESAIRECPDLELLVNNAGFGTLGRFWEADLEGQDQMHRLHVITMMRLTHAALKTMVPRDRGAVINVSSVAAFGQTEGNVSYCATKTWANAFTQGLDIELNGIGSKVKVQALCPGFTFSEFHDVLDVNRANIPGFLWMQADAVVEASLRGLERGNVIVIPGAVYRIGSALMRHTSHSLKKRIGKPWGKDKRV